MKTGLAWGIGINDADYKVQINKRMTIDGVRKNVCLFRCPYYTRWYEMIRRGYSKVLKQRAPTYKDVSVCSEWLYFSNFKAWMEQQDWQGLHLDKDILVKGNKEYSPDTCVFIPSKVNAVLTDSAVTRGEYPLGVYKLSRGFEKIYKAEIRDSGNLKHLKAHSTPEEAHKAWQWEKAIQIDQCISWYAAQDCFRTDIADGLMQRVWQLRLDHSLSIETVKL